jgi:hypothetical protein
MLMYEIMNSIIKHRSGYKKSLFYLFDIVHPHDMAAAADS